MESSFVQGRYKQYKEGTNTFIDWLVQAANKCSVPNRTLKDLIGRAETKSHRTKLPSSGHAVVATVSEILALSKAVAAEPEIAIPFRILQVLQKVLEGREQCALMYTGRSESGQNSRRRSDDGHAFFNTVLRNAAAVLFSVSPSRIRVADHKSFNHKSSNPRGDNDISNYFARLDVEELQDDTDTDVKDRNCPAANPGQAPVCPIRVTLEHTSLDQDLALWCLLKDLSDVRKSIRDAWVEYARGDLSLDAAGKITNTGFGLMRRANDEFVHENAAFSDYWHLYTFIGLRLISQHESVAVISATADHAQNPSCDSSNPIELLCLSGAALAWSLNSLVTAHAQSRNPKMRVRDPVCAVTNEALLNLPSVRLERWIRNSGFVAELHAFGSKTRNRTQKNGEWQGDEVVQGLMNLVFGNRKGVLPIWLAVACQTSIEIDDIIGNRVRNGFLQCLHVHILSQDYLKQSDKTRREVHQYPQEKPFQCLYDAFMGTPVAQMLRIMAAARKKLDLPDEPGSLFTNEVAMEIYNEVHPKISIPMNLIALVPSMHCELMHGTKQTLYRAGLAVASEGWVILAVAHLYKACRFYGLLDPWPDMDFVLANHRTLVTKTNKDADPYALARQYRYAFGASLTSIKPHTAERPAFPSSNLVNKKARRLKPKSALLSGLSEVQSNYEKLDQNFRPDTAINLVLEALTETPVDTSSHTQRRNRKAPSYTPSALLETYKSHFVQDEPLLNFPLLAFHGTCFDALVDVAQYLNSRSAKQFVNKRMHGYRLVDSMLWETGELVDHGVAPAKTPVGWFASGFKNGLSRDGNFYTKVAFAKSSGRIPKDCRPEPMSTRHSRASQWSPIDHFFRVRIAQRTGLLFEGETCLMPVYMPNTTEEGAQRLAKIEHWILQYESSRFEEAVGRTESRAAASKEPKHLEELNTLHDALEAWADAEFSGNGLPALICEIMAGEFDGESEQVKTEKARLWLIETFKHHL